MRRHLQKIEVEEEEGATIIILNTIIKYIIILLFIIELASKASPTKLLKIQNRETKIDKDTQNEEILKPM